jgi:HD-GYP domain-containing protein (c-di-GMP phosphodiesterase class II)
VDAPSYVSISPQIFPRFQGPLPFDIYVRLSAEKFTKIFNKGQPIETPRLESYILRGIKTFHILRQERPAYTVLTGTMLEECTLTNDFSHEDSQHILDQAAESVLNEIFTTHDVNAATLKMTTNVVRSYVSITRASPSVLPQILKLAKNQREIFRHCIMTSIFSTLLARALLPEDASAWFNAGLAGFLHDVGMGQLAANLDEHNSSLPNELKKQVNLHPRFSAETLEGTAIAASVQNAIRSHHEYWDGSGYPRGLKAEEIPVLARIVTVTEQFANHVSGSETGIALSPNVAILTLRKSGKVDPHLLNTFAKLLKIE